MYIAISSLPLPCFRLLLGSNDFSPFTVCIIADAPRKTAINNTKMKQRVKQQGKSVGGRKIKQKDVQRGKIPRHLTEKELIMIYKWFVLRELGEKVIKRPAGAKHKKENWGKNSAHVFEAVRDNLLFKLTHQALLRGDDIRSEHVTWAHSGLLKVEPGKYSVTYIIHRISGWRTFSMCTQCLILLFLPRLSWRRSVYVLHIQGLR